MKLAQVHMLVSLPDEFEGNVDAVLEHVCALPPCTGPRPKLWSVANAPQLLADLRRSQWPQLEAAWDNGRSVSMAVVGLQWDPVASDWVELDVGTFQPKSGGVPA